SSAVNGFLPSGGIFVSASRPATMKSTRLAAALPALRIGPALPPLTAAPPPSRRRPPRCFCGPWHERHAFVRIGSTSRSTSTVRGAAGGSFFTSGGAGSAAASHAASGNRPNTARMVVVRFMLGRFEAGGYGQEGPTAPSYHNRSPRGDKRNPRTEL